MRPRILSATMVAALALGAWLAPAQAQQSQASQRPEPQQMNASERLLEDRIFVELAERAWAGADFKVNVDGGTVTLSGTVPTEQTKQRILRIARRTAGVTEVRDQLRIDPSVGAQRGSSPVADSELSKRVAQNIASVVPGAKAGEDWWLTGWRVEGQDRRWNMVVQADDGAVTLEGDVPYHSMVRKAVEAALKVQGVRSVRSELEIDAFVARYPYYPYPYRGYPYGARYYDPDYFVFIDPPATALHGRHTITGEVTRLDRQKGTVTLKTDRGSFDLHFPPTSLQNVKQGERITVEMGFKRADAAAASPRMDSSGSQKK